MANKLARLVAAAFGAALAIGLVAAVDSTLQSFGFLPMRLALLTWAYILIYVACGIFFAIIFYLLSPSFIRRFTGLLTSAETELSKLALVDIFIGVIGLLLGLLVAFLVNTMMSGTLFPALRFLISAMLYFTLGYLGWSIAIKRRSELNVPGMFKRHSRGGKDTTAARPKILDTSVIIDGRIADICDTGIMEGEIVVPAFVLRELQHIADSADSLKRVRGRRGLDILSRMQKDLNIPVQVLDTDYEDIPEVDAKLLRLAEDMGGVVVTNDYNLNKVASVQRVPVFNINDLANAVKPALISGEELSCTIVKEGKEPGQGVAYLDDGTMIVVDGGRRLLGEMVTLTVTSVLQTSAGRMIFAKVKGQGN